MRILNIFKRKTEFLEFPVFKKRMEMIDTFCFQQKVRKSNIKNMETMKNEYNKK